MQKRVKLIKFLTRVFRLWRTSKQYYSYTPSYRIVNIEQSSNSEYQVTIQLIGKNILLEVVPEKLLADDKLVNCFSPTDIRTLTYLGYLGINSPKYKILAKHLSEKSDQILFSVHKKGEKKYKIITADEISKNEEMIQGLSQQEAHMVGLTTATEQPILEKRQKEALLKNLGNEK